MELCQNGTIPKIENRHFVGFQINISNGARQNDAEQFRHFVGTAIKNRR